MHYLEQASRQVSMDDFRKVLETFRPSGQHSQEYRQEQADSGQVCMHHCAPKSPRDCRRE